MHRGCRMNVGKSKAGMGSWKSTPSSLVLLPLEEHKIQCRIHRPGKGQILDTLKSKTPLWVDVRNNHIDGVTKASNRMLGFVWQNLRKNNSAIKTSAYVMMMRWSLHYYASVWNRHKKKRVKRKETVQRPAFRYVTSRHSITSNVGYTLAELEWAAKEEATSNYLLQSIPQPNQHDI